MPEFMLILHDNPAAFANVSIDEIQRIIGEYVAWKESVAAAGKLVGGNKLTDEGGRHMQLRDGQVRVTDGPYAEAKEIMGGYFTISATSYDEAVDIARTCPHLTFGGRIEVRMVEQTGEAAASGD